MTIRLLVLLENHSAHGHPAFNTPSVFGRLAGIGQTWKIYGYSGHPLTAGDLPDTIQTGPNGEVVSGFARFQADASAGQLDAFSYIEPGVGHSPEDPAPPPVRNPGRTTAPTVPSRVNDRHPGLEPRGRQRAGVYQGPS